MKMRFTWRKLAAVAVAGSTLIALSGCSGSLGGDTSTSNGDVIKIGYVTPQTGALAPFGEADSFVLDKMATYFKENGVTLADGSKHEVEIISKDTQSDAKRAADVASELILEDQVSLILVSSTPDTTNPVSDQCEANQVVCISTVAPWQAWYFGRGATPEQGFKYTFHFFWGLDDVLPVYSDIWAQGAPGDTNIGMLFPNDADGSAWLGAAPGFAEGLGYTVNNPGAFPNGTTDFSAQISSLKENNDTVMSTIMIPPDFITFWKQAVQQGYNPKVATVAKAILFPSVLESMGNLGNNLSTEIWWAPTYPFSSSLTGQSSADFAASFEKETGQQWTQPLGFAEALFEVANAALAKSASASSDDIAKAMSTLQVDTMVGPLDWAAGPVPGVAVSPVVGGQWRLTGESKYELVIVSNKQHPEIPTGGSVEPIDWPKQ
ncbi:branched-chain amino acid transport system substrate-binding protein [Aurantimicrobium minutum]|uniref:ABC transporter substrate-binding protein n=1 Tax=Aurantimicrobium minutum TaxID=708131 RepID=UPI0024734CDB|nr:ABC transporter substrate-binding protein [Aurantimicrobium minutum]MDH6532574.1 branched-chain amino acid transport system substrate-binding protein [Aurantimicrobium minutum]